MFVARLIDSDLQKTFSRYTDLIRNQKPEIFHSELIPKLDTSSRPPIEEPIKPPPARPEPANYTGVDITPPDLFAPQPPSMLRPTQPPINSHSPQPTIQPAINPQPVNQQPTMSAQEMIAIEKLNALVKQMEERDQERKKKEEERKRKEEEMKMAEAQYATAFGMMNPMMGPMFTPPMMPMAYPGVMPANMRTVNPMGYNQGMSNFTGTAMPQPMYTGSTGFQVFFLYEG